MEKPTIIQLMIFAFIRSCSYIDKYAALNNNTAYYHYYMESSRPKHCRCQHYFEI